MPSKVTLKVQALCTHFGSPKSRLFSGMSSIQTPSRLHKKRMAVSVTNSGVPCASNRRRRCTGHFPVPVTTSRITSNRARKHPYPCNYHTRRRTCTTRRAPRIHGSKRPANSGARDARAGFGAQPLTADRSGSSTRILFPGNHPSEIRRNNQQTSTSNN